MRLRTGTVTTALAILLCTQARALKVLERITPQNAERAGFAVTVKPREDGTVRFTVTREIAKARWPGRDATLEVRGEGGPLVTCPVAGHRDRAKNAISYWFDLAKDRIPNAVLTVTEVQTAGNKEDGEKLVGGGTYYELRLADFPVGISPG